MRYAYDKWSQTANSPNSAFAGWFSGKDPAKFRTNLKSKGLDTALKILQFDSCSTQPIVKGSLESRLTCWIPRNILIMAERSLKDEPRSLEPVKRREEG